ncbi:MAG: hypothetical protein AAB131_06070 [Actinomycetota bacterium]
MPISKGEPWGDVGPLPPDAQLVRSNRELWELIGRLRAEQRSLPPVALLGGDLMRSVGGSGDASRLAGDVARMPIDIARVEADGQRAWFAAHLVARRSWWAGSLVAVMNAEHHGRWDVAPRAHPNDGRLDVVSVSEAMSVRDRGRARSRLRRGAHVPHPSIEIRQREEYEATFQRPTRIWLDGVSWITTRSMRVTVEPDALVVCV